MIPSFRTWFRVNQLRRRTGPHPGLLASLALLCAVGRAPAAPKLVVGHQMLAMPRYGGSTGVDGMREEIEQWKELGLDATMLFDANTSAFQDIARRYYEAATLEGYKLAISASYFGSDAVDGQVSFLSQLAAPPYNAAQLYVDGKFMLSAYHASVHLNTVAERLEQKGIPVYLQPFVFPRLFSGDPSSQPWELGGITAATPENYAVLMDHPDWRDADGYAAFEIGRTIEEQADKIDWLWDAARARGKSARGSIVAYYKGFAHKGNWMVYEGWGYARLQASWQRAIDSGIPMVELITLNDFAESSYFNSWAKDDPPIIVNHWNIADVPALLDHSGFRYFSQRYIQWFKTGVEPAITQDELYYAYRLHPRDAVNYQKLSEAEKAELKKWIPDGQPAEWIYRRDGLPESYKGWGGNWSTGIDWTKLSDGIHVAVRLKAPADVYINGVKVGSNLPAGEHLLVKPGARSDGMSSLGYPLYTFGPSDYGYPTFEIRRNGKTVISHTGELEITPYAVPGCWNVFARKAPSPAGSDDPDLSDPPSGTPPPASEPDPSVEEPAPQPPAQSPEPEPEPEPETSGALALHDIGSPDAAGLTTYEAATGRYSLTAVGADIWWGSDQFHFASAEAAGDVDLVVRLDSMVNTNEWAKAGLMLRTALDAGAPHVSLFFTPGHGAVLQWRPEADGISLTSEAVAAPAPAWLKLTRRGGTFTGYVSNDGTNWTLVDAIELSLPETLLGGLAATSHSTEATTVEFTGFQIEAPTPTPPPAAPVEVDSTLRSISTRGRVGSSDTLTAGFVVGGTEPKQLLVRAIGPTLAQFGVSDAATAVRLEIFRGQTQIGSAGDWSGTPEPDAIEAATETVGAFALPRPSRDSALLMTLAPGAYTARVTGADGAAGVALVEVHDVAAAKVNPVVNLSTRGIVRTGSDILIAGFVIEGDTPKRVLVRGVGPGLSAFKVDGVLANPRLDLYRGSTVHASNDDWGSRPEAAEIVGVAQAVGAFPLATGSADAAMLLELEPGVYTAHLYGADGGTGAGLVEIYEVP